jgi:hypothetical protein
MPYLSGLDFFQLLLSVNMSIRQEFEAAALETIETAARTFEQQSTPPNYACTLQAKFLNNVAQEYARACRRRCALEATTFSPSASRQPQSMQQPHLQQELSGREAANQHQSFLESSYRHQLWAEGASGGVRTANCEPQMIGDVPSGTDGMTSILSQSQDTIESEWAAIFMNAGFDIGGGVFVSN